MKYKTLFTRTDKARKKRSSRVMVRLQTRTRTGNISPSSGLKHQRYVFETRSPDSQKGPYKTWIEPFMKMGLKKRKPTPGRKNFGSKRGGVVFGDNVHEDAVGVWCACEDFRYVLEYSMRKGMAMAGARMYKQYRGNGNPAPITNPDNKKFMCKHILACFKYLKSKGKQ